jgi:hypothetical protein
LPKNWLGACCSLFSSILGKVKKNGSIHIMHYLLSCWLFDWIQLFQIMSLHIYNISAKYLSNFLSNKDFIPKKKVKIVRSAMLFCDILKKDFFLW